ncbi:MAG: peptidoglycan DD-metalloendopeptidase family protein [Wenzhouxiangella sp.]
MRVSRALILIAGLGILAACAPWQPVPVDDRRSTSSQPVEPVRTQTPPSVYQVQRGDTLYSLSFRYGLDWRDVAEWNRVQAPYTIRPGQELRMSAPPSATARPVAGAPPPPSPPPVNREPSPPSAAPPVSREPSPPSAAPPADRGAESRTSSPSPLSDAATRNVGGVIWRWPTQGTVSRPFDAAATRRGIGVQGQVGQEIVAAADGEVVYSGTALIGYGELIIVKHSETMLSAYGHNRRRLVEEGERVRGGQAIAEMGMNERDEQLLHFEIRRNGRAEDPLSFLPAR